MLNPVHQLLCLKKTVSDLMPLDGGDEFFILFDLTCGQFDASLLFRAQLLFLLRKNPLKIQRLVRYLSVKDTALSIQSLASGDTVTSDTKRVKRCKDFLRRIDTNSGQLMKAVNEELFDEVLNNNTL